MENDLLGKNGRGAGAATGGNELSRTQRILLGKIQSNNVPAETRKALEDKKIVLTQSSLYIARMLGASGLGFSGTINLSNNVNTKSVEITNFENSVKTQKYVNAICDYLSFEWALVDAPATVSETAVLQLAKWKPITDVDCPTALKNGALEIKVGAVFAFPNDLPLSIANEPRVLGSTAYGVSLDEPLFLVEEQLLEFHLKVAGTITQPDGKLYCVRLTFRGSQTKLK